jgi:hypothetical protein
MSRNKQSKQKIYKVTLSKTFQFPSCVINESNKLVDLQAKAIADMVEDFGKNPEEISLDGFSINIESELPFAIRNSREESKKGLNLRIDNGRVSISYIITELATHEIEQKYGKLDHEENPGIFDVDFENVDEGEEPIYFLKNNIETEFEDLKQKYWAIIENRVI